MQRVRAMASSNWQTVGTISSGFDASARPTYSPGVTTTANCHLTAVATPNFEIRFYATEEAYNYVATLGIDLSSIPAEPNVKFKGNRHVSRVKGQFNYSEKFSRRKTRWTGKSSWWKLLGSTPADTPSVWRILDEPKNAFLQSSVAYDGGKEHTKAAFLLRIHSH